MGVAGWRGGTRDLAPGGRNPRAATELDRSQRSLSSFSGKFTAASVN